MSAKESIHGLNCPRCGGIVPLPEGQLLVQCPYCEQRSFVRGERGLRRYQVGQKTDRAAAVAGLQRFLKEHRAITPDAVKQARLTEAFVAYLPFWVTWAQVLGWVFGQEKVGSGDDARYEPREVKIAQEMNWNQAACDVGEFGVTDLPLTSQQFEAFDPQALHAAGMVFEPLGSASQAQTNAEKDFAERVHRIGKLDRVAQVFSRLANLRQGLVYYPLWVLRYLYKGRAYQVVVDGHTGRVLYGKAPGSNLYRAAILVGGMALGAFLAVDVSALAFYVGVNLEGDGVLALLAGGVAALAAGFGMMAAAYRKFRYGEIFEYRGHQAGKRQTRRQKSGETYHAREV